VCHKFLGLDPAADGPVRDNEEFSDLRKREEFVIRQTVLVQHGGSGVQKTTACFAAMPAITHERQIERTHHFIVIQLGFHNVGLAQNDALTDGLPETPNRERPVGGGPISQLRPSPKLTARKTGVVMKAGIEIKKGPHARPEL
jgi:hypothetical protein